MKVRANRPVYLDGALLATGDEGDAPKDHPLVIAGYLSVIGDSEDKDVAGVEPQEASAEDLESESVSDTEIAKMANGSPPIAASHSRFARIRFAMTAR